MKKFLLSCAAVAMAAMSANAQLYLCGEADGLGWNPGEPMVVDAAGGQYTFTLTNATKFKMSTAMGGWDAFNAGAYCIVDFNGTGEFELAPGDGDIIIPWTGDWTFVLATDMTKVTVTSSTPEPVVKEEPELYFMGSGAPGSWGFEESQLFTRYGHMYYLTATFDGAIECKFAGKGWNPQYIINEEAIDGPGTYTLKDAGPNNCNCTLSGVYSLVMDTEKMTLTVTEGAGIAEIEADNAADAVYYNLQGVRVANPERGLFIRVSGNKAVKVVL